MSQTQTTVIYHWSFSYAATAEATHHCNTLLQQTTATNHSNTLLQDTTTTHSCNTPLFSYYFHTQPPHNFHMQPQQKYFCRSTTATHYCNTLLQHITATHYCNTLLQHTTVTHHCNTTSDLANTRDRKPISVGIIPSSTLHNNENQSATHKCNTLLQHNL